VGGSRGNARGAAFRSGHGAFTARRRSLRTRRGRLSHLHGPGQQLLRWPPLGMVLYLSTGQSARTPVSGRCYGAREAPKSISK
jgi:hypothetical protein